MKRHWLWLWAGALLLTGCSLLPTEEEEPAVTVMAPVTTQREIYTIARGPIESRVSLTTSFGAEQQESMYFLASGRLQEMNVKVGDPVEAGQLLAELENDSAESALTKARIALEREERALTRAREKIGFVDEPTADELADMEVDLELSRADLASLQQELDDTRIRAPYAGRVLAVYYAPGDQVEAYAQVLVLAADGPVVARTTVDDATAAQLRVGQAAALYPSDGNPTPVPGQVLSVPLAGTLRADKVAVFGPEEASPRLQPGRNGRVEIVLERRDDTLLVPLSAIRTYGGRYFVTVVEGETRQEVAIQIGLQSDTHAEVLEGLQAGDRVVGR